MPLATWSNYGSDRSLTSLVRWCVTPSRAAYLRETARSQPRVPLAQRNLNTLFNDSENIHFAPCSLHGTIAARYSSVLADGAREDLSSRQRQGLLVTDRVAANCREQSLQLCLLPIDADESSNDCEIRLDVGAVAR